MGFQSLWALSSGTWHLETRPQVLHQNEMALGPVHIIQLNCDYGILSQTRGLSGSVQSHFHLDCLVPDLTVLFRQLRNFGLIHFCAFLVKVRFICSFIQQMFIELLCVCGGGDIAVNKADKNLLCPGTPG